MGEAPLDLMIANILHRATPKSDLEDSLVQYFIANLFDNVFQTESILEANCMLNWGLRVSSRQTDSLEENENMTMNIANLNQTISYLRHKDKVVWMCHVRRRYCRFSFALSGGGAEPGRCRGCSINLRAGVKQPVIGGVLISGIVMHTYKMELTDVGIYRMTELSQTSTLRNMQELTLVPTIVANLLQLRDVILTTASKSRTHLREIPKDVLASADPPKPGCKIV
ncbi:hypothetical protein BDA99DRAFT_537972 [Phascolomyces articulosus]|uniref:Uncharacterized protein n=1 Tax=Phascolomyces articulosus TaxID=60185 RepID=A0AAD5JZF7_9FUNG|nr:hypothetical protein BDA99DRAFT_537972 [Phascolomyces articulosus]